MELQASFNGDVALPIATGIPLQEQRRRMMKSSLVLASNLFVRLHTHYGWTSLAYGEVRSRLDTEVIILDSIS